MATVPLKPVRLLVQAQFSILLQKDPQNVFLLQNIQDAEQVEVAVLCGIWNGLVDIVAGVPKMISMLASIGSSKGWDDIEKIYVTMSDYKNPETGNVGITGALSDGVSTMFDPGKPCELAHNTSGIVVGVAICFINPTAIEGTFGQVIANVVKIVQRLDAFADALNPLSRISNFVLKSAGTAMQTTLKNGKLIIKVAMRADEVFREVDWKLAKTAQMIGPDGRTYTILMSNDPMDAARTAGRKLKEILDDEKGIPLTDANGNSLAKMEVTDADGKITEEVAVVKLGSEISEEAADLLTRLKNRLKNDYKWTDEEILTFEGDFNGDLELLRKFDGDEGWVSAWKYLDEAGVDETLRRNIDALADPDAALDAIQMSQKAKPTWPEIQALWKRGNDYNAKARLEYGDNRVEVVLKGVDGKTGKRLDTYLPPANGQAGQIISRKATTLSEIQPNTFRNYLNELITKYPKGAELSSSKFPPGTTLDGDYFLEIPTLNRSFFESSAEFQKVLSDFNAAKGVDIKIKYLDE